MNWVRQPAIHFVVVGAGLFALKVGVLAGSTGAAGSTRTPIVVTAAQVDQLLLEFSQRTGLRPSAEDEAALVGKLIDDEVLYRRAVELGFDRNDRSVRYRLVQKMRFLSSGDAGTDSDALYREALDLGLDRDDAVVHRLLAETMRLLISAPAKPVGEDSLRAYFERHPEWYVQPARVTLTHVFLSAQRGAAAAQRDAALLLERLRADRTSPDRAVGGGDPFPLGHHFVGSSQTELAKCFGAEFAARVMDLPLGTWSRPITSSYGTHLVWIEANEPARLPPFEAVRRQVAEAFAEEQRQESFQEALRELRQRYVIRVEPRRGHSET